MDISVLLCYMHDLSQSTDVKIYQFEWSVQGFFFFFNSDLDDKKGIWDKPWGPTVKHRELYSATCDKHNRK